MDIVENMWMQWSFILVLVLSLNYKFIKKSNYCKVNTLKKIKKMSWTKIFMSNMLNFQEEIMMKFKNNYMRTLQINVLLHIFLKCYKSII